MCLCFVSGTVQGDDIVFIWDLLFISSAVMLLMFHDHDHAVFGGITDVHNRNSLRDFSISPT